MNNPIKFNLNEISEKITKPWSPENIETVNDYVIGIARFDGKYHWHRHDKEDIEEILEINFEIFKYLVQSDPVSMVCIFLL